jgi:hypothetical protein
MLHVLLLPLQFQLRAFQQHLLPGLLLQKVNDFRFGIARTL